MYQRKLDLTAANPFTRDFAVEDLIVSTTKTTTRAADRQEKYEQNEQCSVLTIDDKYSALRRSRQKSKETHTLSDTASTDGLNHTGPDYSYLAYPANARNASYPLDGIAPGLFTQHAAITYKAEVFTHEFLGSIETKFVGGIGWAVSLGARSFSNTSTTPTTTSTSTASGNQKDKCTITVGSKWAFTTVDDTNPWEAHSIITPIDVDMNGPAFTDPLPFVDLAAEEGTLAEPLFKPVRGPEKRFDCDLQQISYVGWLYPNELKAPEE